MSERGYVYHDHPRPFCGEGCPAYGESPLIQRYRKGSAMSEALAAQEDDLQAICPKCGYDYGRHLVPGNLCPDAQEDERP